MARQGSDAVQNLQGIIKWTSKMTKRSDFKKWIFKQTIKTKEVEQIPVDKLGIWTCAGPWSASPGGSSAQREFHTSDTWTCEPLLCEFPVPLCLPTWPCTSCICTCARLFCALQGTFHCCIWNCSLCNFADASPCGVTSRSLKGFYKYRKFYIKKNVFLYLKKVFVTNLGIFWRQIEHFSVSTRTIFTAD